MTKSSQDPPEHSVPSEHGRRTKQRRAARPQAEATERSELSERAATGPPAEATKAKPVLGPEHLNSRPDWNCIACGDPWPCKPAREKLLEEFRSFPSMLTIYLSTQMHDALDDLVATGHFVPTDLFERFLAWARRPPVGADDDGSHTFGENPADSGKVIAM